MYVWTVTQRLHYLLRPAQRMYSCCNLCGRQSTHHVMMADDGGRVSKESAPSTTSLWNSEADACVNTRTWYRQTQRSTRQLNDLWTTLNGQTTAKHEDKGE